MSQQTIDARGMSYPTPVVMAQKAISQGCTDLTIFVDDIFTVDALAQMAGDTMDVGVAQKDGVFAVILRDKQPQSEGEQKAEQ